MDDLSLLRRFVSDGDRRAMSALIEKYQQMVFAACLRRVDCNADADDATQQVFLALIQGAGGIRSNVGSWLYRCALNTTASMLRSRRNRTRREREKGKLADDLCHDTDAVRNETAAILDECLGQLDRADRELLIQSHVLATSQRVIAASLGVSQQAVAKRIRKASQRLRQKLAGRGLWVSLLATTLLLSKRFAQAAVPTSLKASLATLPATSAGTAALTGVIKAGAMAAALLASVFVVDYAADRPTGRAGDPPVTARTAEAPEAPSLPRPDPAATPPAGMGRASWSPSTPGATVAAESDARAWSRVRQAPAPGVAGSPGSQVPGRSRPPVVAPGPQLKPDALISPGPDNQPFLARPAAAIATVRRPARALAQAGESAPADEADEAPADRGPRRQDGPPAALESAAFGGEGPAAPAAPATGRLRPRDPREFFAAGMPATDSPPPPLPHANRQVLTGPAGRWVGPDLFRAPGESLDVPGASPRERLPVAAPFAHGGPLAEAAAPPAGADPFEADPSMPPLPAGPPPAVWLALLPQEPFGPAMALAIFEAPPHPRAPEGPDPFAPEMHWMPPDLPVQSIPEPASLAMLAGTMAFLSRRRIRHAQNSSCRL